jgi:hypothetical protein
MTEFTLICIVLLVDILGLLAVIDIDLIDRKMLFEQREATKMYRVFFQERAAWYAARNKSGTQKRRLVDVPEIAAVAEIEDEQARAVEEESQGEPHDVNPSGTERTQISEVEPISPATDAPADSGSVGKR